MPPIVHTIQGIHNGVSQQHKSQRLENQNEDQTNCFNSLTRGLEKRPGTTFIKQLDTALASTITGRDVKFHKIQRDNSEEFLVLFTADSAEPILCYKLDGTKMTINYGTAADRTYCVHQPSSTTNDIRATTVADTTIVVNRGFTPAMAAATSPDLDPFALIWARKTKLATATTDISWSITVNGTESTGSSTSIHTQGVADAIKTQLDTDLTGFTVTRVAGSTTTNVLKITKDDGADFTIVGNDSQGNTGIEIIKDTIPKVSDLPPAAANNDVIKVVGDKGVENDAAFYVKFSTTKNAWIESIAPDTATTIDAANMPRKMVRGAGSTFDVTSITWDDRGVGDTVSAPDPSFIGNAIQDVAFHKGRLIFVAGESVVASKVEDFFDFFPTTATEVLDSDPFDITHNANSVSVLKSLLTFQDQLLMFSDTRQFALTAAGNVLTPSTANIDETTAYEFSDKAVPVKVGSKAYFVVEKQDFSAIREYFIEPDTLVQDALNITGHVPRYIPKNVKQIFSNNNQSFIGLVSYESSEKQNVYVYQFFDAGEQRPLAAWNKWTFGQYREVLGLDFFGDELYIIFRDLNNDATSDLVLEKAILEQNQTGSLGLTLHADRLLDPSSVTVTGVQSGSPPNEITTVTIPMEDNYDRAYEDQAWIGVKKSDGSILQGTRAASGSSLLDHQIVVPGHITVADYFWVKKFQATNKFSEWQIRNQNGGLPIGVLLIHKLSLSFENTGPFQIHVTPFNQDESIE